MDQATWMMIIDYIYFLFCFKQDKIFLMDIVNYRLLRSLALSQKKQSQWSHITVKLRHLVAKEELHGS